ncbi:MAG: hypothetical protein ACYC96_02150 [Fimbriimonadaceae bacterium]
MQLTLLVLAVGVNPAHILPRPPNQDGTATGVLVMQASRATPAVTAKRSSLTLSELESSLRKNKYSEVAHGSALFFFSPRVWQQKRMERVLAQYTLLSKATRPDGTVDLSKDADLLAYAQESAGDFGDVVTAKDAAQLSVQRTYTFQVGGRSVDLPWSSLSEKDSLRTSGKALAKFDRNVEKAPPTSTLLLRATDHFAFYAYGVLAESRTAQRRGYKEAISTLQSHLAKFYAARDPMAAALIKRICGFDVSRCYGESIGGLPPAVQSALTAQISSEYEQLGFASRQDAMSWLQLATLTTSRGTAFLELPKTSAGSTLGIAVP